MQPTTPTPTGTAPDRRSFRTVIECAGRSYAHHANAADAREATARARGAAAAQPGFTEAGMRVVSCVDLGPHECSCDRAGWCPCLPGECVGL